MPRTSRYNKALPWGEFDDAIFEIDQETTIKNKKEFIDVFVFVPMVLALNYGHPDHRIIHLAKRLIVPRVSAGIRQLLHIDQFKRSM
jgi:hypothetical protein